MKNNFSKILITILAMVTLLCVLVIGANAADVVKSGVTDTGFAWTVTGDATNGYVLTITDTEASKNLDTFSYTVDGKGPNEKVFPWGTETHRKVVEIIYQANASTLGDYVFWDAWALRKVTIPKTVTAFGFETFRDSAYLATIAVEGEDLGENTLNFKYIKQILPEYQYTRQFVGCFSTDIDYKVYLSNDFQLPNVNYIFGFATTNDEWVNNGSAKAKTSRFDEGDIFYIPEDYPSYPAYRLGLLQGGLGFTIETYPKIEVVSAMEMYGYQVRIEGYNGLRGIFNFNENVKNEGFTLIEYGAILAADANRGADDANIKLSYNESTDTYEPMGTKIVKMAIGQNGGIASGAKVLKKLNGNEVDEIKGQGYTWFATTLVNFNRNYKDDVYMCGYEIYKNDITGDISIIYTGYEYPEYESTSIYDVSVSLMADGFTNDLVNSPVGSVVKAAGAVKLTSADAFLPAGATELVAENIEMKAYANGAFTDATVYYSFYDMPDGNYLAYISGSGNLSAAALKTNYASDYTGDARPVPTLLGATHNKITHIVIGEGIVDISSFDKMKKLEVIVYPATLKTVSKADAYNVFQYSSSLRKIVPVGMMTNKNIFEFGNVTFNSNNLFQWSFQGCSSVEYIHLGGYRAGNDIFYGCSALKAIWIGNAECPKDGVADFRNCSGTTLDMGSFTNTPALTVLLLSDTFTSLKKSDYGFSIKTVYQAKDNGDIKTFCESGDPSSTAAYTQTLPPIN